MSRVVLTPGAIRDIRRCQAFLAENAPSAAQRAGITIFRNLRRLETAPQTGRLCEEGLRELVIAFGDAGYLALYVYEADQDLVQVLAVRHQREAGY